MYLAIKASHPFECDARLSPNNFLIPAKDIIAKIYNLDLPLFRKLFIIKTSKSR